MVAGSEVGMGSVSRVFGTNVDTVRDRSTIDLFEVFEFTNRE